MELSELRAKIDEIDAKIRELLLERFDISRQVGMSKINSDNKVIYRADREAEILDKLTLGLSENDARLIREIYRKIMLSSRNIQYRLITDNDDSLLDELKVEKSDKIEVDSLICQGIEGAYSHLAARRFSDKQISFKSTFREVFDAINGLNYGILPLDNSTQGMVSEVYDLLMEKGLYIVKSIDLPINHVAMALKGATMENIKYITAHSQALSQCSKYIERHGLTPINASNNAVAAKGIATGDRYDICCLGDRSNAERYGLDIIDEGVSNTTNNTTRFIVVADRLIAPSSGGKVSIIFSMENSSGTLANVLNIIASYGISMSKIESRPIADDKWEYRFYADIEGNIHDKCVRALIYELKSELPFIKVLGSYDEL